ncbi:MAG: hypothetical protein IH948_06615 [Bacteroidetes bacterium]|nr:hypothetical protein [Bacteroidota bacterium]
MAYRILNWLKGVSTNMVINKIIFAMLIGCTIIYSGAYLPGKAYAYLGLFFLALPMVFSMSKDWKWDAGLGALSYPMYISHFFVMWIMERLDLPIVHSVGLTLTVLTILFLIGVNQLLEKRIEKIRQKRVGG